MKNKLIGIVLLLMIVLIAVAVKVTAGTKSSPPAPSTGAAPVSLHGFIGGEKMGLLDDPNFQKLLRDKYKISLTYTKMGSIEMVQADTSQQDFLFPSSQTALEMFKQTKSKQLVKAQDIFVSPIVLYSWDNVTDALIKQGIVKQDNGTYYVIDMPKFLQLIQQGKKWSDIGLNDLYGKVSVITTDPNKSNSGNMFTALLANLLNGDVIDETTVGTVAPKVKAIYDKLGYLPPSSADLFDQYLRTGAGANPIIVGYENQMVEFAQANPNVWNGVKDRIRVLYPTPTIWSDHTFMALNGKAVETITALSDKDIQKLAWEKHGFRSGIPGVQNDPKALTNIIGIPPAITQVVQMPKPGVMEKLMQALK